jgi:hypothetical protein
MQSKLLCSILLVAVLTAALSVALAQSRGNRAAKEFMRDKLELSQRVLEGIATEDYDLIIAKGTRLSAMTKEADWRLFEKPGLRSAKSRVPPPSRRAGEGRQRQEPRRRDVGLCAHDDELRRLPQARSREARGRTPTA